MAMELLGYHGVADRKYAQQLIAVGVGAEHGTRYKNDSEQYPLEFQGLYLARTVEGAMQYAQRTKIKEDSLGRMSFKEKEGLVLQVWVPTDSCIVTVPNLADEDTAVEQIRHARTQNGESTIVFGPESGPGSSWEGIIPACMLRKVKLEPLGQSSDSLWSPAITTWDGTAAAWP